MDLHRFIELLNHLYNGNKLGPENQKNLDIYAAQLIEQMANNKLDYDTQNALDTYIIYFEGMTKDELPIRVIRNIRSYNLILDKRSEEKIKESQGRVLKPRKVIDNTGAIKTITVIEIVCLLGIFIAAIILALIFK